MLNENIKNLRKQKGYSQETLAQELNVVRQTVSKWEKGYSVPDAVMLEKLAELLEVSVSDLLGGVSTDAEPKADIKRISDQLSVLNNQIARELARKKRNRRIILIVLAVIVFGTAVLVAVLGFKSNPVEQSATVTPYMVSVSADLDRAISDAVKKVNSDRNWQGECFTEGHFIYGTDEKNGIIKVYMLEAVSNFGFKNGFFMDESGHSVPTVYTFKKNDSSIELVDYKYAEDGSLYGDSVRNMFPSEIAEMVLHSDGSESAVIWQQCTAQAEVYLEKIGRKAEICSYGDIEHILFSSLGVSIEVENLITEIAPPYDFMVENHETVENGTRYVYQSDYNAGSNLITFTKFEYETGRVVEFRAVSGADGKEVKNVEAPKTAEYRKGRRITSKSESVTAFE